MNANYIKLIDSAAQVNFILTDFCLLNLSITEKGALKSLTLIVFYFTLMFYHVFIFFLFKMYIKEPFLAV